MSQDPLFNLKQKIILKEDCYFVLSTVPTFKGNPIYVCKRRKSFSYVCSIEKELEQNCILTVVKESKKGYIASELYCDYYFLIPKKIAEPYYRWQEIIRVFKEFSFLEGNLVIHSIILLLWGIWLLLTSSPSWLNFPLILGDLSIIYSLYCLYWLISSKFDY